MALQNHKWLFNPISELRRNSFQTPSGKDAGHQFWTHNLFATTQTTNALKFTSYAEFLSVSVLVRDTCGSLDNGHLNSGKNFDACQTHYQQICLLLFLSDMHNCPSKRTWGNISKDHV